MRQHWGWVKDIFNVFIFLKSLRGFVRVNRRAGSTVLWINVFDLFVLYTSSIHGNPKALERPTAVNNQQQSITRIICTYHLTR